MNVENKTNSVDEILQLVSFKIGEEEFGVDILKVQEINRMFEITQVPNSPEFVEGIINLRGKIIPVIDLRIKLNLAKIDYDSSTRVIVVEVDNKVIGFIVDEVSEVLRIPASITEAPPVLVSGIDSRFITSIGKLDDRLLILLDLEETLSSDEKLLVEKIG